MDLKDCVVQSQNPDGEPERARFLVSPTFGLKNMTLNSSIECPSQDLGGGNHDSQIDPTTQVPAI